MAADLRTALLNVVSASAIQAAIRACHRETPTSPLAAKRQRRLARRAVLAVLLDVNLKVNPVIEALQKLYEAGGEAGQTGNQWHALHDASHRIGTALAWGIRFLIADEVVSAVEQLGDAEMTSEVVERLAQGIDKAVGRRASSIAMYELNKAKHAARMDGYHATGVRRVAWVGGTCRRCARNAAASPIDIHTAWPDGPPPVHGRCSCTVVPA